MLSRVIQICLFVWWAVAINCSAQQNERYVQLSMPSYEVVYDNHLGVPVNIQWYVSRADIGAIKREPSMSFLADERTSIPRVLSSHYNHSGYHRGHMVPAADRTSSLDAMLATFVMTNVCPQVPALNTGAWKRLENYERSLALRLGLVCVRVAPIFTHEDTLYIGNGRVAVPHGFIKVIYAGHSDSVVASQIFSNQHDK